MHSFIRSFIQSVSHSVIHSFCLPSFLFLSFPSVRSFFHSFFHFSLSFFHFFILPSFHSFMFIHSLSSCIYHLHPYIFIRSFTHSLTHSLFRHYHHNCDHHNFDHDPPPNVRELSYVRAWSTTKPFRGEPGGIFAGRVTSKRWVICVRCFISCSDYHLKFT